MIFPSRSSYHSTVFFSPATSQKPFSLFGNPRIWTRCLKTGKALFWAAVFLLSSNTLLNISLLIPPFCGPVITISFFSHTFGTIYLSIRLSFFFWCFLFWILDHLGLYTTWVGQEGRQGIGGEMGGGQASKQGEFCDGGISGLGKGCAEVVKVSGFVPFGD